MNWDKYRQAMDELPISEDFEDRLRAAVAAVESEPTRETGGRPAVKPAKRAGRSVAVRRMGWAVAAVIATFAFALTAHAAATLMAPEEVVQEFGDGALAAAFASEDAVLVDETQRVGDYDVTLVGLVTGENLTAWMDPYERSATYAVIGLRRADGEPITDETVLAMREAYFATGTPIGPDELYWSDEPSFEPNGGLLAESANLEHVSCWPLVGGCDSPELNDYLADVGWHGGVADGAYYLVVNVNDLMVFADHPVYLVVYEGMGLSEDACEKNPDGSFSFKEGCGGAMFKLPLDPADADPEKAAEILAGGFDGRL